MASDISVKEFGDDAGTWDRWIGGATGARLCHQHDWLQLVRDVYGGEPHYLAACRGDQISAAMPVMLRSVIGDGRVLISVPFADEGGIISDDEAAEEALLEGAREIMRDSRASRLELRQRHPAPGLQSDVSRVNMEMALPDDAEHLWDDFKGKVRNQVRKAEKAGLTAHVADDTHAAISDDFYPVYCENTRDLGSPMHSERFFHEVADRFPDAGEIVTVSEGDSTVGSAYALLWRDRFAVPWASSLRRYFKKCPNNLLYWELMRVAIERECAVFDFGRSPVDSGTYRFKEQWGAEPCQLHYCHLGHGSPEVGGNREGRVRRAFSSIWQKTPLPIARTIGPKIFARLPI